MNSLTSISGHDPGYNIESGEGEAQNDVFLDCDVPMHTLHTTKLGEDSIAGEPPVEFL